MLDFIAGLDPPLSIRGASLWATEAAAVPYLGKLGPEANEGVLGREPQGTSDRAAAGLTLRCTSTSHVARERAIHGACCFEAPATYNSVPARCTSARTTLRRTE